MVHISASAIVVAACREATGAGGRVARMDGRETVDLKIIDNIIYIIQKHHYGVMHPTVFWTFLGDAQQ